MTCRAPSLSFLPGSYQESPNFGKTHYGRKIHFERNEDVRLLVDKITPYLPGKIHERYPSVYTKDAPELPSWIAYDKQVLTFDAYFQETVHDSKITPLMIRICKIYFFLEDGTIKITEPKKKNSGTWQGTLLARTRVGLPPPKDHYFYDIIDFNIGKEIEIYGRVYKIVNCDNFTRTFLNRLGVAVPDRITMPEDPYMKKRETDMIKYPKRPKSKRGKLLELLENDKVLRFYGYWDDRKSEGGYVHDLTLHYYLVDDTMELIETHKNKKNILSKRGKVYKNMERLPDPGFFEDNTLLNVMGNGRYKTDLLHPGRKTLEHFKAEDLVVGAAVNLYGRKIVLRDCDLYTKNYYVKYYGIDNFTPMEKPKEPDPVVAVPLRERKLPPWNGFGSFIDSAQNCITVEPKPQLTKVKQFLQLDRFGFDSHILRFKVANRAKAPSICGRTFTLCYYLCDDTISIHEVRGKHAGPTFMKRTKIKLPGQEVFVCEEHDYYTAQHLFVGATIDINGFVFIIIDADEYALRYMEMNSDKFPKSNIKLILQKIRKAIEPIYHEFLAEVDVQGTIIPFDFLREKFIAILGDDLTEHEMITLARYYSAVCKEARHSREYIRSIVLYDLRRNLWQHMDRFKEAFKHYDINRTGYLTRREVYNLVRGCKLPIDSILVNSMIDILDKNEKCEIKGQDLFDFLDETVGPRDNIVPVSHVYELSWSTEPEITAGKVIDWCKLAADISPNKKEPEKEDTPQE